jgi:hypothetical protein
MTPRAHRESLVVQRIAGRQADTVKQCSARSKSFVVLFSKKNKSSFSEEKEAKRLLFLALR